MFLATTRDLSRLAAGVQRSVMQPESDRGTTNRCCEIGSSAESHDTNSARAATLDAEARRQRLRSTARSIRSTIAHLLPSRCAQSLATPVGRRGCVLVSRARSLARSHARSLRRHADPLAYSIAYARELSDSRPPPPPYLFGRGGGGDDDAALARKLLLACAWRVIWHHVRPPACACVARARARVRRAGFT